MISASQKRNVIPALTEVTVDCRLLPGQTQAGVEPMMRAWLGEGDYELVWGEGQGGTRSAMDTPLWAAAEAFIAEAEPGSARGADLRRGLHRQPLAARGVRHGRLRLLPRQVHGPATWPARLVHSADERADVDDLELGVRLPCAHAIGS